MKYDIEMDTETWQCPKYRTLGHANVYVNTRASEIKYEQHGIRSKLSDLYIHLFETTFYGLYFLYDNGFPQNK